MSKPILAPDQIDHLGKAILTLAQELWTLKDRQLVLEAVLADQGVDVAEAVDRHVPDAALKERLAKERKLFSEKLVFALSGQSDTDGFGRTDHAAQPRAD